MDAFSRKGLGLALADHLQASLPLEALDKAIASRGGSLKDLIHHSDRGRAIRLPRLRPAPEPDRRPRQHEPPRHAAGTTPRPRASSVPSKPSEGRRQSLSQPRRRPRARSEPSSTTSTTPADCIPRSAINRPLSSRTNSDKLRNVKQTNPCPCHRISRVSAEGRSPVGLMSEIVPVKGIEAVPLKADDPTTFIAFSSAIGASATDVDAARAFLTFLQSSLAKETFETQGLTTP